MYKWDWSHIISNKNALIDGAKITIELNLYIILIGSTLGLVIYLIRRSSFRALKSLAILYIDIFRTLPVLVLLVWFFYCIPALLGGVRISPFFSAVIVLSLNLSSFVAEIVRSGIDNIPTQHIEAAKVSGLSNMKTFRFITLPIALRNVIPPLVGQYINTIKLSVLASIIAVPELLSQTTDLISQTYRPFEFYTVLAFIFLLILIPGTILSRRLENKKF